MRNSGFLWVIIAILALLDIYVFQVVKLVSQSASARAKTIIFAGYWTVSAFTFLLLILLPYLNFETWPKTIRTYTFATVVGLFFAKIIAVSFFMIDDIRRLVQWAIAKLFVKNTEAAAVGGEGISRSAFISWLGLVAGGTLFGTLVYGFGNKYNYNLKRLQLAFDNLPRAFKGLKIIHISDIHSGSFNDKAAVQRGVDKIMNEKPDLILFTGDLVNDRAAEMHDYISIFNQLKAPLGVYSTLGNHDYGDYVQWENKEVKAANLQQLKEIHAELGWRLLMNEHVVLEKENEQIAVLGIENWGAKGRFPKYGKMNEAHPGTERYPFKILLSHDPSHWDAEVKTQYPDIDLMLSGHTHGMQFGVELPGFKWSPVQYMYKQWAGLYETGKQKLYVNRGFGFIGYPGRVGILPEITLIELT
jgi:uncharacterized protein